MLTLSPKGHIMKEDFQVMEGGPFGYVSEVDDKTNLKNFLEQHSYSSKFFQFFAEVLRPKNLKISCMALECQVWI